MAGVTGSPDGSEYKLDTGHIALVTETAAQLTSDLISDTVVKWPNILLIGFDSILRTCP